MHVEKKRIFVGNLPPYVDENEIKKQFSQYGKVVSVDIKQRKGNTEENVSPVFAFVNIEIDNKTLQKCFQEVADYNWQGYYVNLQLAKESFLDRLKREREEAQANGVQNNISTSPQSKNQSSQSLAPTTKQNGIKNVATNSEEINKSSSDSEESDDEGTKIQQKVKAAPTIVRKEESSSSSSESSDSSDEEPKKVQKKTEIFQENNNDNDDIKLIIKSNKHKMFDSGGLKIESVNSTPIHVIEKKGTKNIQKDKKTIEADVKRKQSLMKMKNSYNQQKNIIQSALSRIDTTPANKKRSNQQETTASKKQKLALFEDGEDENEDINFEVKNQFEGKKGQKLLELQSRFTNDKRFTLDERFADDEENELEAPADDEREKQFEILESVLGQKVRKKDDSKNSNTPRGMLRFDPSKPEHSKFEIKRNEHQKKDKRKQEINKEKVEVTPIPEVSKEQFYQVKDNLKESLKEKEGFSLLSMFGRAEDEEKEDQEPEQMEQITKSSKFDYNRNPFKYDSSDSEDEQKSKKQKKVEKIESRPLRWAEPFFFKTDDNRLKDGLDFLKNINNSDNAETFKEKRRALQRIIHGKVKNVERDKRKFQRQLRKRIKVKNARKS